MIEKPSIPKGTRDYSPEILEKRNFIFDSVKKVFQKFGYKPIETPAMENLSTLTGKYGEEGDKLVFKILNSGNFLKNVSDLELHERNTGKLSTLVSEKGLRYDLTVPFARYIVQYRNEITFPFKRYQIQPVWRGDRPAKGRYREFYQCDADIIGSDSLVNELEIIQMIDEVFYLLNLKVSIKINNRKILEGIVERIGYPGKMTEITVAIDKIDKIGLEKVCAELVQSGIDENAVRLLVPIISGNGSFNNKIEIIKEFLGKSEIGKKGVNEVESLFEYIDLFEFKSKIQLDLSLARGLNYYTGAIFEVVSDELQIGSLCGGGRYDDLTGIFGLPGVSGVGISFGADRIFDVLENLRRFPDNTVNNIKLMFVNYGENEERYTLKILQKVREMSVHAEIYPDNVKLKKQFKYANDNNILFVAIIGENEMKEHKITLKNMHSGEQQLLSFEEFMKVIT
jgi:histidyl-tRNA synthetase